LALKLWYALRHSDLPDLERRRSTYVQFYSTVYCKFISVNVSFQPICVSDQFQANPIRWSTLPIRAAFMWNGNSQNPQEWSTLPIQSAFDGSQAFSMRMSVFRQRKIGSAKLIIPMEYLNFVNFYSTLDCLELVIVFVILISFSCELNRPMLIILLFCTLLLSLTIPTIMSSESPSFHPSSIESIAISLSEDPTVMPSESLSFYPSSNVPTIISPSVDSSYFFSPDEYMLTNNFTQVKCFSHN